MDVNNITHTQQKLTIIEENKMRNTKKTTLLKAEPIQMAGTFKLPGIA
jgi:hypothetical protein